jgi:hypothetical protein
VKDRPTDARLARLGSARERDRGFVDDAQRGRPQQRGFATLGCNAAMVMAVPGAARLAGLQRRAGVGGSAALTRSTAGADYAAAIVFMHELAVLETHRVANDRKVRDARKLARHRAQRQRTRQVAAD